MKYIDANLLRKKIESLRKNYSLEVNNPTSFVSGLTGLGKVDAMDAVLAIIDSLQQEQPEVDLKKEIKEWTDLMVGASSPEQDGDFISEEDYRSVIRQTAIHFLGINARKEDKRSVTDYDTLDEAADVYFGKTYCDVDDGPSFGMATDAFKAGAQWMKDQLTVK